jgi:protein pelota
MRIKSNIHELVAGCAGKAILLCDNVEDLWHLYNIVGKGDFIKTITFRKVAHESGGKSSSTKKKINITIKVEEIEYDQKEGIIRYKGKNVSENEFIAIGQYQSIEIAKGLTFTVFKKTWDEFHIERLKQATDPTITSDLAAIVMEEGVAHVYLISSHITTLKAKIEQSIPKKRKGPSQHDKSITNFFQKILDAIVKNINFEIVKCIIVASPGFVKDQFGDYLQDSTSNNKHYEIIQKNLNKFVYVHSSNGYKQALSEVLSKPEILMQIKNTKASEDVLVMERFNETLGKDMDRVIFGLKPISEACEKDAIDTLILSDNFLRKVPPSVRANVTSIMKSVKSKGGSVVKMSSQHVTGEKIDSFGGITAILRYAMPELTEGEAPDVEEFDNGAGHEEIEDDDKEAMNILNSAMEGMNLNDEDDKPEKGNVAQGSPKKNLQKEPEEEIPEEEEEEDEGEYNDQFTNNKVAKGDKSIYLNKHKGKPTRVEMKEREIHRKTQLRKKSGMDEEI